MDTLFDFLVGATAILLVFTLMAFIADMPDLLRGWQERNLARFDRLFEAEEWLYELARETNGLTREGFGLMWSGRVTVDSDLRWLYARFCLWSIETRMRWNLRVGDALFALIGAPKPTLADVLRPYTTK
jgi:hypothetical protein